MPGVQEKVIDSNSNNPGPNTLKAVVQYWMGLITLHHPQPLELGRFLLRQESTSNLIDILPSFF